MKRDFALCLMVKAPTEGLAKTRLNSALRARGAAAMARGMLFDAIATLDEVDAPAKLALTTGQLDHELQARLETWQRIPQDGDDLGARMENALREGLEAASLAIVVGSDIPTLESKHIHEATDALQSHDVVLGPASDGGFYLIGVKKCHEGLLSGIAWSRSDTMMCTMRKLEARGLRVATISTLDDVDTARDLLRLMLAPPSGHDSMPHTRRAWSECRSDALTLSVVIPILNEEARIAPLLRSLLNTEGVDEILVVDGGSSDRSVDIVSGIKEVRLMSSPPGRALQMNKGARAAKGSLLLFLHADSKLPRNAPDQIRSALRASRCSGGAFQIKTQYDSQGRGRPWVSALLRLADFRSRYSRRPYGDQGIFVRKAKFDELGGFPELPLFEELAFSTLLERSGQVTILPGPMRVSGRRFQQRPFYYFALMNSFPLLYRAGVPPRWLAALYSET